MKAFKSQGPLAEAIINPDLAEAKHVITITQVEATKRAALAESMATQFSELEQGYAKTTVEEKLFLLTLVLNLMLHAFQTKQTDKKLQLKHTILSYYHKLFAFSDLPLTALQKAKWSAVIANVHRTVGYRTAANEYYKQAIASTALAMKATRQKAICNALLLTLYADLAALHTETATHYEASEPAPDLAYQAHKDVVKACDAALLLVPDQALALQLNLMKAKAFNKLAAANYQRKNKPTAARDYWYEALKTSFTGVKIANVEAKNHFVSVITTSLEGLITIMKQSKAKENISPFVTDLEKACQSLKNGHLNNVLEVEPFIERLSQALLTTPKSTKNLPQKKQINQIANC